MPLRSDALADSVGVNTHVSAMYTQSDYGTVLARMQELGVRHVRDGIIPGDAGYANAIAQLLAASNAGLDGAANCAGLKDPEFTTSPAQIAAFDSAIGNRLDVVEGPNEVDNRQDANWASDTVSCLPSLRDAEPQLRFIAPSLDNPNVTATDLGDISSLVDLGNIHRYFGGHNPGSSGWGNTHTCGVYGALDWALCLAAVNAGSKPSMITETGYNSQSEVDEATQAKYLSRALFVNLAAGVQRSYIYMLKDYSADGGFGGDGLIRGDDSEKPAFAAIENVIAAFTDRGQPRAPGPLYYSVTAGVSSIRHLLFQRTDGSYVLALWNETASWDPSSSSRIGVAGQPVSLAYATAPAHVKATMLTDDGALTPTVVSVSQTFVTLMVDDHVTLLRFE